MIPSESYALAHLREVAVRAMNELESVSASIDGELRNTWWQGPDGDRFRQRWGAEERPWLHDEVSRLQGLSGRLRSAAQAEDERVRAEARAAAAAAAAQKAKKK